MVVNSRLNICPYGCRYNQLVEAIRQVKYPYINDKEARDNRIALGDGIGEVDDGIMRQISPGRMAVDGVMDDLDGLTPSTSSAATHTARREKEQVHHVYLARERYNLFISPFSNTKKKYNNED
jgi:hypothetical protein